MKAAALSITGLLLAAPVQTAGVAPPAPLDQYDSTAPITVMVTYADPAWVDRECRKRVGPERSPPVIEACAGVGSKWMIKRHGAFYPGQRSGYVDYHEIRHVRGWRHP